MGLLGGEIRGFLLCGILMLLICHYVIPQSGPAHQTFEFRKFEATVNDLDQMIYLDEDNAQVFKSLVFKELEARGLTSSTPPDIYVDLFVQLKYEQQVTGGYSGTSDGTIDGHEVYTHGVSNYEVGTFIIQLIRPENNQVLWEGSNTITLWNDNKKKNRKKVGQIVNKIFKDFDPGILGSIQD